MGIELNQMSPSPLPFTNIAQMPNVHVRYYKVVDLDIFTPIMLFDLFLPSLSVRDFPPNIIGINQHR
jgi:hypothetical protein